MSAHERESKIDLYRQAYGLLAAALPRFPRELFRWLRHNSAELLRAQPDSVWSHTIAHPENGWMTMDDWLDVYARHVPDHIGQMAAVYAAWREAPGKPLA